MLHQAAGQDGGGGDHIVPAVHRGGLEGGGLDVPAQPGKEPGHPQLPQNRDDEHPKDHRRSVHRLGVEDLPHRGLGQVRPRSPGSTRPPPGRRCIHTGRGRRGWSASAGCWDPETPAGSPPRRPRPRGCSPRRPQGPPTRKTPPPAPCPGTAGRCTGCPPPPASFPTIRQTAGSPGSGRPSRTAAAAVLSWSPHLSRLSCSMLCALPHPGAGEKKNPQASCLCLARGSIHCHLGDPAVSAPPAHVWVIIPHAPHRKARLTSGPRKPPALPRARLALPRISCKIGENPVPFPPFLSGGAYGPRPALSWKYPLPPLGPRWISWPGRGDGGRRPALPGPGRRGNSGAPPWGPEKVEGPRTPSSSWACSLGRRGPPPRPPELEDDRPPEYTSQDIAQALQDRKGFRDLVPGGAAAGEGPLPL